MNLIRLPVPPLTASVPSAESLDGARVEDDGKGTRAQEAADLVAALSFGLDLDDAPIQDAENKHQDQSTSSPTPPYHRLNSAPAGMETLRENANVSGAKSSTGGHELRDSNGKAEHTTTQQHTGTILQTASQHPAPADYVASDGHIWRAKYCVLEDGVLYFYRNEQDGNSIEAQLERQEMSLFHNSSATGGSSSSKQQEGRSASHYQLEDLSKSPGPRQFKPSLLDSHNHPGATSFCRDGEVLWEKRVALDHVGEVRSAELEYGAKSFELLAVGYEDNPNALDESHQSGEHSINMADRLILRAGSKEDMNEWLFQFHRSLASFMKQIVNMVGSNMAGVGDLHLPEQFYPSGADVVGVLIPPAPQRGRADSASKAAIPIPVGKIRPPAPRTTMATYDTVQSYSPGSQLSSLLPESALSHGHGRSGMHRRRVRTRQSSDYSRFQSPSPLLSPGLPPEQDRIISASVGRIPKKGSLAFSWERDAFAQGSSPKDSSPKSDTGFDLHPPRVKRMSPSNKDAADGSIARPLPSSGKYIPPHLRPKPGRTYVPPHLRNLDSGKILSPAKPPSEDEESSSNVPFDWTDDEVPGMNRSDGFGIEVSTELCEDELQTRSRATSDVMMSPHFILGGCADPTAAIGSIEDDMYVPRKASRVGKFHTKGHGGFGGQSSSDSRESPGTIDGKKRQRTRLRWEVGAMSECGIRESNEDAYIISHDLSAAFFGWRDHHEGISSIFDAQHYGLFAIFDGHCGNHAARYASEKLPGLLFEEYKNLTLNDTSATMQQHAETMLTGAIQRLDHAFCTLCYAEGRDWESGATALVVLLVDDLITVANLGDSRGVMCISREDQKENSSDHPWYVLEDNTPRAKGEAVSAADAPHNHILWQEITDVHCPGRDDERERIESANGWITTETEIPISQLQRIDFLDADVVEILQRCFSDRFDDSDPSADVHRAGKQCNAEPGRLLHISRVCGELAVSRAIGDRDFKESFNRDAQEENGDYKITDETGWESPLFLPYPEDHSRKFEGDLVSNLPEFRHHRAGVEGHSNEFLLLACDGLWDVMDADDAVRVARGLLFEKEWTAQKVAARLAELAMHLGSSDNITVIVVRFFIHQ